MASDKQKLWILEFFIRQEPTTIKNNEVNRIISAFKSCSALCDYRLLKSLLLRRISVDIEKGLVSERILESLEMVDQLDHREGGTGVLSSMKDAYCAVAMDCTVKYLKENPKKFSEYCNAINRIWKGRMVNMGRLYSDGLKDLMTRLEGAVHDISVCDSIVMQLNTRNDALKLVGKYLEEVTTEMGPSFLDSTAEKVVREKGEDVQVQGLLNTVIANQVGLGQKCSLNEPGDDLDEENDEHVSENNFSEMDADSSAADNTHCLTTEICNPELAPECMKVNEKGKELCQKMDTSFQEPAPESLNEKVDQVQFPTKKINTRNSRRSLMERNSTAHTFEWEEGSASCPNLPTPKSRNVTRKARKEEMNPIERRKKNDWSAQEEKALIDAVKKHGIGNWKNISDNYSEVFAGRTNVDIKDKWRNLTRTVAGLRNTG